MQVIPYQCAIVPMHKAGSLLVQEGVNVDINCYQNSEYQINIDVGGEE